VEAQGSNPNRAPIRVGVILAELGKLNVIALEYLIVHLNVLQHCFEFEILPLGAWTRGLRARRRTPSDVMCQSRYRRERLRRLLR
jgi:hypothetical protein